MRAATPEELSTAASLVSTQRDLVRMIARGGTYGQMMQELGVTRRTLERRILYLRRKTGIYDRVQLALWAVRVGIIDLEEAWAKRFIAPCLHKQRGRDHGDDIERGQRDHN